MKKDIDKILIVNDVTAYGRVSSLAMLPVMTAYGLHPYVLPTAIVSNTMDYGSSAILDTSAFMRDCIKQWKDLGFGFTVMSTGLINSYEQVDIIDELIETFKPRFLMVDPIMADNGELYPGMFEGAIVSYRKLINKANLIVPNFTEATLIADKYVGRDYLNMDEYIDLVDTLKELTAADIVISACKNDEGNTFNLVYTHEDDNIIAIKYDKLPYDLVGTGDVFSATLLSELVKGSTLFDSVNSAAELVRKVVLENTDNKDHYDINIERTLQEAVYEIRQR